MTEALRQSQENLTKKQVENDYYSLNFAEKQLQTIKRSLRKTLTFEQIENICKLQEEITQIEIAKLNEKLEQLTTISEDRMEIDTNEKTCDYLEDFYYSATKGESKQIQKQDGVLPYNIQNLMERESEVSQLTILTTSSDN